MMNKYSPQEVLALPMAKPNDANADTIGQYLVALLSALWEEREGFSGNRPLGNSDWEYPLYIALGRAGAIDCAIDEDGFVWDCDYEAADAIIKTAIATMADTSNHTGASNG